MPHTLLLADDSVTIQRVIELTFAEEDVQVVAVSDGNQAIARLESAPPDIVLADIGMPGKNGYEVAEYVKQSPKLSHIPVVLLQGAFEPVDQARAREVRCDGVLAKPFEPQLVIGRVKELLDAQTPPAAAPSASAHVSQSPAELDDYFDRLDVAFAKLSTGGSTQAIRTDVTVADQIDQFASERTPAAADLPLSAASRAPVPSLERQPSTMPLVTTSLVPTLPVAPPVAAPPAAPPPPPAPSPPAAPVASGAALLPDVSFAEAASGHARSAPPSIAEAFVAILDAERRGGTPDAVPVWPSFISGPPAAHHDTAVTDDLIEQTTLRVIERLSDQVGRDRVAEIVADVAERLIREEIERIKASIR